MHFLSSIWEGMGICETRLGHFDAARALLDKAKRACVKPPAHAAAEDGEVEYEAAAANFSLRWAMRAASSNVYTWGACAGGRAGFGPDSPKSFGGRLWQLCPNFDAIGAKSQ